MFSIAANEARSSGEVTESVTDVLSWKLVLGCLLSKSIVEVWLLL